jgi:hypothetical protein
MAETYRTDLVETLVELRRLYPDWRFGQLISNVAGWADHDVWDVEDEQLLVAAKEHLRSVSVKSSETNVSR